MPHSADIAVYPGSFDPVTNGHIDIVARTSAIFDRVIVAVLDNRAKETLFSPEERHVMLARSLTEFANVEVRVFSGLLVDFMKETGARIIVRGLRFVSDFEYELQIALMNQSMMPGIETFFMASRPSRTFVSSSLVKEIASHGRDTTAFVPQIVADALAKKLK